MKSVLKTIFHIFCFLFLAMLPQWSMAGYFIENKGQWPQNVVFVAKLGRDVVFFEKSNLTFLLTSGDDIERIHHQMHHVDNNAKNTFNWQIRNHAYKMHFENAQKVLPRGERPQAYYENYYLGSDPKKWVPDAHSYGQVRYPNLWPGVDAVFYFVDGVLKYDLELQNHGALSQVSLFYEGLDTAFLNIGGLVLQTSLGQHHEENPISFGPRKHLLKSNYMFDYPRLTFEVEPTDGPITIDPTFVFSSYTGSTADNFGFTATYDNQGRLYAGGIVFGTGYPTSTGAFQTSFQGGGIDVGITVFSADGTSALYSTYLGGNQAEQPHSMVVNNDGELFVMGVTSSQNFPVSANAFQSQHNGGTNFMMNGVGFTNGSDIFITRFNASGTQILASTYMGGTANDGMNFNLVRNYADEARGEIIVDEFGHVVVASSTLSINFPTANAAQSQSGGIQDGVVFRMPPALNTLSWSTYLGGQQNDGAYALKNNPGQNQLFVTGATRSLNFVTTPGVVNSNYQGGFADGFITRFNLLTGVISHSTFTGTPGDDINFFVDLDLYGNPHVLGVSTGDLPVNPGFYQVPNSSIFIQRYSADLSSLTHATRFGNGQRIFNLAPSAFMVDSCGNLFISGWGGLVNLQGSVVGFPVTPDAYQDSTNGSDFYFAVIDGSWRELLYATFFGGQGREHVDGGTSRFAKDGTIYQAICASCQNSTGFPVFPSNAWSTTNNSPNCNLAGVKIAFEMTNPRVKISLTPDSVCIPYTLNVVDSSTKVDYYIWDFGDGTSDTGLLPVKVYTQPGKYTITAIGIDTLCNLTDTDHVELTLYIPEVRAGFTAIANLCDPPYQLVIENESTGANAFIWDFGDGTTDTARIPTKTYSEVGEYQITLVAMDTTCGVSDTLIQKVQFIEPPGEPEILIEHDRCVSPKMLALTVEDTTRYHHYHWDFGDGGTYETATATHEYLGHGTYTVVLTVEDTLCNRQYTTELEWRVEESLDANTLFPNIFTPNGDGRNDYFTPVDKITYVLLTRFTLKIYNRWGNLVYEASDFNTPWDGAFEKKQVASGVYFWILEDRSCDMPQIYKGFVHLER